MSNEIDFSDEMQALADVAVKHAPKEWEKISLIYEIYTQKDFGVDLWAITKGKNIPIDIDENDIDSIEIIFKRISKKTVAIWRIAKFNFTNKGECEMSFEY